MDENTIQVAVTEDGYLTMGMLHVGLIQTFIYTIEFTFSGLYECVDFAASDTNWIKKNFHKKAFMKMFLMSKMKEVSVNMADTWNDPDFQSYMTTKYSVIEHIHCMNFNIKSLWMIKSIMSFSNIHVQTTIVKVIRTMHNSGYLILFLANKWFCLYNMNTYWTQLLIEICHYQTNICGLCSRIHPCTSQ